MVNIQLQDTVAAALNEQARSQGLSLDEYLAVLAQARNLVSKPKMTGEELDRLLDEEAASGPAYQGTYPRSEIYRGHD
jgi:hypothetical protein